MCPNKEYEKGLSNGTITLTSCCHYIPPYTYILDQSTAHNQLKHILTHL